MSLLQRGQICNKLSLLQHHHHHHALHHHHHHHHHQYHHLHHHHHHHHHQYHHHDQRLQRGQICITNSHPSNTTTTTTVSKRTPVNFFASLLYLPIGWFVAGTGPNIEIPCLCKGFLRHSLLRRTFTQGTHVSEKGCQLILKRHICILCPTIALFWFLFILLQ